MFFISELIDWVAAADLADVMDCADWADGRTPYALFLERLLTLESLRDTGVYDVLPSLW